MSNIIQIKRGGNTPQTTDLYAWELGYDYSHRVLYINDEIYGAIVPIGALGEDNVEWLNQLDDGPILLNKNESPDIVIPAIPVATLVNSGVITTVSQNLAGIKCFKDGVAFQHDATDTKMVLGKRANGNLTLSIE